MTLYRVGILTVSDTAAKDPSTDQSGPLISQLLGKNPNERFEIKKTDIVPDDQSAIRDWVEKASQSHEIDWILTTGGTGLGIRDCTPEAISPLIERPAPGLIHLIMSQSIQRTPFAALSRPVAGTIGRTLVLTLPGSPKAVRENLSPEVLKVVQHALSLLQGGDGRLVHEKLGLADRSQTPANIRQDRHGETRIPTPTHQHLSHDPTAPVTSRHRISPYPMIPFEDAVAIVLRECRPLEVVDMKVDCKLAGHVLAEDVFAAQNVPNTFTTNVDGYALRSDQGPGTYRVVTPATHPLTQKLPPGTIMRVNTGAPIPVGANAVVAVEDTQLESTKKGEHGQDVDEETVKTLVSVEPGENVRKPGSDVQTGERVCENGEIVESVGGEIGTLTFVGQNEVKVVRKPVVAILSTGNELIDVQATEASGSPSESAEQWTGIYDTNRPSLRAALECLGYEVIDLGIAPDTVEAHLKPLKEGLEKADLLITTGGTSMGATDLLKPLIERNLGGKIHFGRVAIKPGSKYIFALPGNPASALVMFWVFVVPALRKLGGYPPNRCCLPKARVMLRDDMPLDPRPEFHRAIVKCTPSGLEAFSTGGQRSSRVASLAGANAFVALPSKTAEKTKLSKGTHADAVLIGELRV
ncbi:hypothetical protein M407DRAFT_14199 [Tulasnella calospora MUT 4182]|uniref:molybdopterin adenylyltransferase n=1 Tax=Tulasnella calospora MUT 4182 TaxID=1051891 RepID=A0A0C3QH28_9AGAM|nr:hypothetical protein M407DRAFT_14199 [Tulasnella calospora MUT 4182]